MPDRRRFNDLLVFDKPIAIDELTESLDRMRMVVGAAAFLRQAT